jgi:HEAT repeat protein
LSGRSASEGGSRAAAGDAGPAEIARLLEELRSDEAGRRVEAADRLAVLGASAAPYGAVSALEQALADAFEPVAINAAYGLARMGGEGVEALQRGLLHGEAKLSRLSAYGLSVADEASVDGLIEALGSESEDTVFHAAFALGEHNSAASSADAVRKLAELVNHPSERLRCAAVDALGNVGAYRGEAAQTEGVEALTKALHDSDSQVRFTAGLSLAKWGARAEGAVTGLVGALEDDNRYVRAHAAEALFYIGTARAKDALLDFLRASRWCPTTTSASTFYP